MKSKNKKELHQKSINELKNLIEESKDALVVLKIDKTQNKLKNTTSISVKKDEIAQMFTILKAKELAEKQSGKKK